MLTNWIQIQKDAFQYTTLNTEDKICHPYYPRYAMDGIPCHPSVDGRPEKRVSKKSRQK